jgi:mannosyltransferase OCH1-like enzyme
LGNKYFQRIERYESKKSNVDKYLVVGSAPFVDDWIQKHMKWFVDRGYKIIPFNNAWKAVPLEYIHAWHRPSDSKRHATFLPTDEEIKQMNVVNHHGNNLKYRHLYVTKNDKSTMLFNILYYLYVHNEKPFTVSIIGSDMIYKKNGDTFYSNLEISKAQNDPVNKFLEIELKNELDNIYKLYENRGCEVLNASYQEETRLPFKRFLDYLDTPVIVLDTYNSTISRWNKHIPNVIYQTYKTNEVSHNMYFNMLKPTIDLNPQCRYEFYSDKRIRKFIQTEYGHDILNTFNSLTVGASKGDLFRYLILYKYGGIYCDIDNVLKIPFSKILTNEDKFLMLQNENDRMDMHVACVAPNHPIMRKLIDKTIENIKNYTVSSSKTGNVTGPFMYREIIKEYMKHNTDIRLINYKAIIKEKIPIKRFDKTYKYWGVTKSI